MKKNDVGKKGRISLSGEGACNLFSFSLFSCSYTSASFTLTLGRLFLSSQLSYPSNNTGTGQLQIRLCICVVVQKALSELCLSGLLFTAHDSCSAYLHVTAAAVGL